MSGHQNLSRDDVRERVEKLRGQHGIFSFQSDASRVNSGIEQGSLPELGVPPGGIVEWLVARQGAGALTSAFQIMLQSSARRGVWAIVDSARECYAPALSGWGVDLSRVLFSVRRVYRRFAGRSSNVCDVLVCLPPGPGWTIGYPRVHGAGNWRRK